ncbi:hypothetical protein [Streptomyces lacrimifluminis]|uniref:Uncharacterized protein n=1 Tax=Streptomyces lacrimifluminis TaxID=1500077 RepID=A0A917L075_9ACTN|nr:hypothetical protein [Streptomyces lacrimifluminis]GGJ38615.1 hypothetical protein GCM10012282_39220 [Streptomyces lacrimifluminis]
MSVWRSADVVVIGGGVMGTSARSARTGPDGIVFCNGVGLGVQDAAMAWAVVHGARGEGR